MNDATVVAILIFLAAVLYASVGHAGASGYLAAMALVGVPAEVMKPTALALNIVVATIAATRFYWAGQIDIRRLWPLVVGSVPLSFVGGAIQLPERVYNPIVGAILLLTAWRIATTASRIATTPPRPMPIPAALAAGAVIGLISGLSGTGGSIFLSPLLLLLSWAHVREVAGLAAAFVLVNSIAGLLGNVASVQYLPRELAVWSAVAAVGAILGAELGSRHLPPRILQYVLALVLVVAGCKLLVA